MFNFCMMLTVKIHKFSRNRVKTVAKYLKTFHLYIICSFSVSAVHPLYIVFATILLTVFDPVYGGVLKL